MAALSIYIYMYETGRGSVVVHVFLGGVGVYQEILNTAREGKEALKRWYTCKLLLSLSVVSVICACTNIAEPDLGMEPGLAHHFFLQILNGVVSPTVNVYTCMYMYLYMYISN